MIADRIIALALRRAPDFIIGNDQLRRWWLIPRNRFLNIYLHQIVKDDEDQALHDHPWHSCSIILRGGYWEITPEARFWRAPGSVTFRRAATAHRLELSDAERFECWSLFVTGPVIREWGFHCPKGWRYWRDFVDVRDGGKVGRGCE